MFSIPVAGPAGAPIVVTISRRRHELADNPTMAGTVSWSRDVRTSRAARSAEPSGGYLAFGAAITRIPAAAADRMPLWESSTAAQRCGETESLRAASR